MKGLVDERNSEVYTCPLAFINDWLYSTGSYGNAKIEYINSKAK